jgi:hypothetical protein
MAVSDLGYPSGWQPLATGTFDKSAVEEDYIRRDICLRHAHPSIREARASLTRT